MPISVGKAMLSGAYGGGGAAVAVVLDHPGGLQVDEDRAIVRGEGPLEHAHHVHLQGVHPGDAEDALG